MQREFERLQGLDEVARLSCDDAFVLLDCGSKGGTARLFARAFRGQEAVSAATAASDH